MVRICKWVFTWGYLLATLSFGYPVFAPTLLFHDNRKLNSFSIPQSHFTLNIKNKEDWIVIRNRAKLTKNLFNSSLLVEILSYSLWNRKTWAYCFMWLSSRTWFCCLMMNGDERALFYIAVVQRAIMKRIVGPSPNATSKWTVHE